MIKSIQLRNKINQDMNVAIDKNTSGVIQMNSKKIKTAAIVLAGGRGSRMQSKVHKQYIEVEGKPILYYTLKAFEMSCVDEIVLVCGENEETYCRDEIISKYQLKKVTAITRGGKERYNSVYEGLKCISDVDCVLIHDGARPFVNTDIIEKNISESLKYGACVTAVRSKDTVKIADAEDMIDYTPDRRFVWNIQTPQTFRYDLIREAYEKLLCSSVENITDDSMVVETMLRHPVKIVEGSYENIKITTPEDLDIAKIYVRKYFGGEND